ncbi:DUF4209 domain-containing protein [Microbacterium sp. KSW4-17]|uniref:DUF4209 domain-containing protein n=1 Tax=Microbacterium galbum TaxID=3075994 RepID=A0ABU3T689_9MICO|nr:DUF4209 domain-containing protein [Microbacterium sp. KSW4-17]MDU0366883.1 DUF4209 domain-containing protein [Microbacterium sp. KSW4-17]
MTDDPMDSERWRDAAHRALASPAAEDADARRAAKIVSSVKDYFLHPADRVTPYRPWWPDDIGPGDLTDEDMEIVSHLAGIADEWRLRIRCLDIIALRASGGERVDATLAVLVVLRDAVSAPDFRPTDTDLIARALALGGLSPSHKSVLEEIEDKVVELIFAPLPDLHYISFSRFLREDKRLHRHASRLAARFAFSARGRRSTLEMEEAAEWALIAGDRAHAEELLLDLAQLLQQEAESRIAEGRVDSAAYVSNQLGLAYRCFLRTSVRARRARGLEGLGDELTAAIRRAGLVFLTHSTTRSAPLPDLTALTDHILAQMSEATSAEHARIIFLSALALADYDFEVAAAKTIREKFPLVTDVPRRTVEKDGRISAMSGRKEQDAFGVRLPVWHQMMRSHTIRVSTVVPQILEPTWQQLRRSDRLSRADFIDIASASALVPPDRARSVGTALFYGYVGDFFTAFQLLVPQIENLVRHRLRDAGESTSRYRDGVEDENSLPSLLGSAKLDEVLDVRMAYELRALFGGIGGPNLRHRTAHGQLPDAEEDSPYPLYVWWLTWKFVSASRPGEEGPPPSPAASSD